MLCRDNGGIKFLFLSVKNQIMHQFPNRNDEKYTSIKISTNFSLLYIYRSFFLCRTVQLTTE